MSKIRSALPGILRDLAGFSGAALLAAGVGMIYRPAGVIVAGALLLAGALLSRAG